jgi:peptidoglycan/LPS O-acetylase OafA/YrhL
MGMNAAPQSDHHNNFDLIRIFSALQVLQMHAASVINLPGRPAWLVFILEQFPGVTIFFIVSGFLITSSYLRGSSVLVAYFARRVLRIYPALWINIILILLMLAVTASFSPVMSAKNFGLWVAITFAFGSDIYGTNIAGSVVDPRGFYTFFPSGVLWTIPIELAFYALLPVIVWRRKRDRSFGWLGIALTGACSLAVLGLYVQLAATRPDATLTKILSINPLTDLWIFMLGAAMAAYWDKVRWLLEGRFLIWLALYLSVAIAELVLFGVTNLNMHTLTPLMPLKIVLLAATVVSFAFTWRNLSGFLRGNDFSYGIYLYHMPIILTLSALGVGSQINLWIPVVGGSLLIAAVSWFTIERPALQLKSRFGKR